MKVFILGYSQDPTKYSNMAHELLKEKGHEVIDINPTLSAPIFPSLIKAKEKHGNPHTLTMYVNPKISANLKEDILSLNPQRVIFNPGSENFDLMQELEQKGVEVVQGCTLVMLRTNQF